MEEITFKFTLPKPYYRMSELLEVFSYKETSLRRLMAKVNALGKGTQIMGCFKLPGIDETLFEPYAFQRHLEGLIEVQTQYNYEEVEKDQIRKSLTVINSKQQKVSI